MKRGIILLLSCCFLIGIIAPTGSSQAVNAITPNSTAAVRLAGASAGSLTRAGLNAQLLIDYGSFSWGLLPADQLNRLDAADIPYQRVPDPYTLDLGGQRFDPLTEQPAFTPSWSVTERQAGPDFQLVQMVAPIKAEWLHALQVNGLEIVQYIHPFTYIVWGTPAELSRASQTQTVRWTGAFAPAYRVLPQWRALTEDIIPVHILLYRGADTNKLIADIQTLGGSFQGSAIMDAVFDVAAFELPGGRFADVAQLPGVYSIQPLATDGGLRGEMSNQINAGNYDGSNLAFPGYMTWLSSIGLSGDGVIIANVDSGIDDNHPDLINNMLSCSGSSCGGATESNHGTHTAGIMAADGASGVKDIYGFFRALGMSPGAKLIEQLYDPTFEDPNGMLTLMQQSWENGAQLSGNSWGPSGSSLGYDINTRLVDVGVRDADPDTPGNQPLSYILSIMNGNGGTSTQGTPDEAKNIFTVGSTVMQTSGGSQYTNINDLSSNTAHGPALDGRLIPHMVAPGCYVDSSTINSYGMICGTSMASPQVAGSVALFIENYRNDFVVDPSPALIKAAFLPVAHDLAGYKDADGGSLGHPFDAKQGWGRLDAAAVLDPQGTVIYFDNPQTFDNTGEFWQQTFSIPDPTKPIRVMLVWTDAPGNGLGGSTPAWNNDLNLTLTISGETYYGNNFNSSSGLSQTGGLADGMNNTEGIFLPPTAAGTFTITVTAANIASDGVPNSGDGTDQDFALVWYNSSYQSYDQSYCFPLAFNNP